MHQGENKRSHQKEEINNEIEKNKAGTTNI